MISIFAIVEAGFFCGNSSFFFSGKDNCQSFFLHIKKNCSCSLINQNTSQIKKAFKKASIFLRGEAFKYQKKIKYIGFWRELCVFEVYNQRQPKKRAVQFGRTLFGRSTFGRDSFEVPSLVDTRVLADTYLVDIVFWSTLCFSRHFGRTPFGRQVG